MNRRVQFHWTGWAHGGIGPQWSFMSSFWFVAVSIGPVGVSVGSR